MLRNGIEKKEGTRKIRLEEGEEITCVAIQINTHMSLNGF